MLFHSHADRVPGGRSQPSQGRGDRQSTEDVKNRISRSFEKTMFLLLLALETDSTRACTPQNARAYQDSEKTITMRVGLFYQKNCGDFLLL